jgi:hypothetical protein
MKIDEATVREMAGVKASGGGDIKPRWVEVAELGGLIRLEVQGSSFGTAGLTPDEARRFARQLYRLAGRIEARQS